MTVQELYYEFNLAYNNLSSNMAPGLDPYEISIYLTKAQNMIVDALYGEFEKSEEARKKLSNLVKTKKILPINANSGAFTDEDIRLYIDYSVVFPIEDNIRYVVNEKVKMNNNADRCIRNKFVNIIPVSHDEVDKLINNPFRFNMTRGFRMDVSLSDSRHVELLLKDTNVEYYQIRYIKTPHPVILEGISNPDNDLKIDNILANDSNASNGELIETLHRQLIDTAAALAANDYRKSNVN